MHSLVGAPPKGHAVSLQGWEREKRSVLHVERGQDKTSQAGAATREILAGQKELQRAYRTARRDRHLENSSLDFCPG